MSGIFRSRGSREKIFPLYIHRPDSGVVIDFAWELEDSSGVWELEDSSGFWLLEDAS